MSNDTRYFVRVDQNNEDTDSVFTGSKPRQAALKVARRLEPADSEEEATRHEVRLRERGQDYEKEQIRVYEAWAWTEETDESDPDYLGDEKTVANVSYQGVEHRD